MKSPIGGALVRWKGRIEVSEVTVQVRRAERFLLAMSLNVLWGISTGSIDHFYRGFCRARMDVRSFAALFNMDTWFN